MEPQRSMVAIGADNVRPPKSSYWLFQNNLLYIIWCYQNHYKSQHKNMLFQKFYYHIFGNFFQLLVAYLTPDWPTITGEIHLPDLPIRSAHPQAAKSICFSTEQIVSWPKRFKINVCTLECVWRAVLVFSLLKIDFITTSIQYKTNPTSQRQV